MIERRSHPRCLSSAPMQFITEPLHFCLNIFQSPLWILNYYNQQPISPPPPTAIHSSHYSQGDPLKPKSDQYTYTLTSLTSSSVCSSGSHSTMWLATFCQCVKPVSPIRSQGQGLYHSAWHTQAAQRCLVIALMLGDCMIATSYSSLHP